MKVFKRTLSGLFIVATCFVLPMQAMAQWSLGVSYEMRDAEPENGYGIRIERDILKPLPIVDIGLRAHFSFFNDDNEFTRDNQTISGELQYYDYGLAATGGVSLGIIKPYVGLGIGKDDIEFKGDDEAEDFSDTSFYWNGFAGAELSIIPKLHPFVEYRFQSADDPEDIDYYETSDGRLILGLSLSF